MIRIDLLQNIPNFYSFIGKSGSYKYDKNKKQLKYVECISFNASLNQRTWILRKEILQWLQEKSRGFTIIENTSVYDCNKPLSHNGYIMGISFTHASDLTLFTLKFN